MDINHDDLVAKLIARWPESSPQPSLERIAALCDLLGNPQNSARVIQVTGTNGKGSTAIMIDALVRSLGLRTGRFTSPHLVDATERICIDGQPISKERFDQTWQEIKPMVEMVDEQRIDGVPMTFFEVITGMAFAAFADAPVDVMILEVGMGGRWDATNIADADVAVITPIDLDHTHILGGSIAEIAKEKAGIIKEGKIAVLAGQTPEAAKVLTQRCLEVGAQMVREGIDFSLIDRQIGVGGQVIKIQSAAGPVGDLYLPLFGVHMAHNAASAVAAVEAFQGGRALSWEIIADGLAMVKAPARMEIISSEPTVIIDGAHNPQAMRASLASLRENFAGAHVIGVTAMMKDKATDELLSLLADEVDELITTTIPDFDRATSAADLAEQASGYFRNVQAFDTPKEAIANAMLKADISEGTIVLVIGSVYLAGAIRAQLVNDESQVSAGLKVAVDNSGNLDELS